MFLKKFEQAGTALMMEKAVSLGFGFDNPQWVNFGQGAPELGFIANDLKRLKTLDLESCQGYTPVAGLPVLREKIASYYNDCRNIINPNLTPDLKIKKDNVNISSAGGRGALFKVFSSLEKGQKIGYLNPDYTAYKELFKLFSELEFKPIDLDPSEGFKIDLDLIKSFIKKEKLDIIFFSNPSNPTGQKLSELELQDLLSFCQTENCLLIHDEFYSKFIYDQNIPIFSALNYVKDLEKTNLIIIDGLTKGWRYPGFRMSWIISNSKNIQKINNLSSAIDGGCSHPIQKASLDLFDSAKIISQAKALQSNFNQKREFLLANLSDLGFKIESFPQGAFYVFANIDNFLDRFKDDLDMAEKLLEQKIIVIPGSFFDVSLISKKPKWSNFIRFSYGLEFSKIQQGVEILQSFFKNN